MTKNLIWGGLLAIMLAGCKDFIEPSLENRTVTLMAPAAGSQSNKYQVGFWWEPVEDALRYRLQVVTPDFTVPSSLVLDTLVEGTKFDLTMEPGQYQWRLRAENGSSATPYFQASFIIHESSLTEQKIVLNGPANAYLTNQASVTLSWDKLFGATEYLLQIDDNDFADEEDLVFSQTLTANQYVFEFPAEGIYQWRVRAQNEEEQSKWSDVRSLSSDQTPPAIPAPVSPAKGAQLQQPLSISWSAVPTASRYRLYLYKSDGLTAYSSTFPVVVDGTSYNFNAGNSGEVIYWKVLAIDQAGNEGQTSELMNFSIQ